MPTPIPIPKVANVTNLVTIYHSHLHGRKKSHPADFMPRNKLQKLMLINLT